MAHTHGDPHTTVVDRDGYGAGMFMGLAIVLLLVIVGLALLFTQPWDDDNGGTNTSPGIEDVVPGEGGGDSSVPGSGDGDGGGSGGDGSGGGDVQPPSGQ
jgi:hypothetical protein